MIITIQKNACFRVSFCLTLLWIALGALFPDRSTAQSHRHTFVIADSLTAEQIDRFGDYTIQRAVIRMSGVQAGRRGEISLRGTGRDRFNVAIDGHRMATTGPGDRSIDLDMFPSGLYTQVDIIKVLTPDMDADAIGGVINLRPWRPDGTGRILDVQAGGGFNTRYFNFTGPDSRASVRYMEMINEELSIAMALNHQTLHQSRETLELMYDVADFGSGPTDVLESLSPGFNSDSKRMTAGGISLAWKPSGHTEYHVGVQANILKQENNVHRVGWLSNGSWAAGDNMAQPTFNVTNGRYRYDFLLQDRDVEQYLIYAGGKYRHPVLKVNYSIAWSRNSVNDISFYMPFLSPAIAYGVQIQDRNRPVVVYDDAMPTGQQIQMQTTDRIIANILDNSYSARIDFEIPAGNARFNGGGSALIMSRDMLDNGAYSEFALTYRGLVRLGEFEKKSGVDVFDRYRVPWRIESGEVRRFFQVNSHIMARNWPLHHQNSGYRNFNIGENIYAAYGMATVAVGAFEIMGGLRMEHTMSENSGRRTNFDRFGFYHSTSDTTRSGNRSDFFPGIHLMYNLSDQSRLNLSYHRSMKRQDYQLLSPFEMANRRDTTLFLGNPALKPMFSNNFDFLISRNMFGSGAISLGIYYKELSNFASLSQEIIDVRRGDFTGINPMFNEDTESIPVQASIYRNSDDRATLYGIELSLHQHFNFLPGFWGGFGSYINYVRSFSDFETDRPENVTLPHQSPHVVNAALSYELNRMYIQASFHWTASHLVTIADETALAPSMPGAGEIFVDQYQDGWSELSLSLRYQISERFGIWCDARGLLLGNERIQYMHQRNLYPIMSDYNRGQGIMAGMKLQL
jgi:TonB-dependent receptor